MDIAPEIRNRIVRNAILSVFIYALPILLMFLTFYFTGQRPWQKKSNVKGHQKTEASTNSNLKP